MNPGEHIQEWQSMFTMLPVKDALSLFSILSILLVLAVLPWHRLRINANLKEPLNLQLLLFGKFQAIPPLQEAFARGILNPKLF